MDTIAEAKKGVEGVEFHNFDKFKVINTIDQKPIGKTPRSIPATYVGAFNLIRALFARLTESQVRGFEAGHFSFNSDLGRCPSCQGMGVKKINSGFLSDVSVDCLDCGGARFKPEILSVRFKDKNISEVLNMTIQEAHDFFENQPSIKRKLKTLLDVGLGYLKIGQDSTTLSGGEAQRVKLGKELSKSYKGQVLYILDEPTTGLHFEDVEKLLNLLSQLVDKGHTVVVIEHQLDLLAECDHLLDLGPFGGKHGGQIVDQGKPKDVAKRAKGVTGKCLKAHLS
jgi:excinuclease ABC subunit A